MNLYSIQFVILLLIALLCYYTVFRKRQWVCLLIVSAIFYYWTGIHNFIFLFLTGASTWLGALCLYALSKKQKENKKDKTLEKDEREKRKKILVCKRRIVLWGIICLNFGILSYFKYLCSIVESITGMIQKNPNELGIYHHLLGLVLPLGISFYIFQSVGYLIDIYNEKYVPERNFAKYMLFVSYFPQMLQGPINRYDMLGSQLMKEHIWNSKSATKAMYRIGYGLLKKYAIANIWVTVIAKIFDNPLKDYAGSTVLLGILLYAIQQYADFSGGIDMVMGVSELFDIHMQENFKQPYFATSLGDFWRRWHISLGKWMRDYVFYPFALTNPMKKLGKWSNTHINKHIGRTLPAALGNILVFFIVGLWHGAESHYIVWGLYNGIIIAGSDMLEPLFNRAKDMLQIRMETKVYRIFQIIRTFIIVNIGWYFDRISDTKIALYSLKKTFFDFNFGTLITEGYSLFEGYPRYIIMLALLSCVFVFIISVIRECKIDEQEWLYTRPIVLRWIIYLLVIGCILLSFSTRIGGNGGFMYANF